MARYLSPECFDDNCDECVSADCQCYCHDEDGDDWEDE